MASLKKVAAPFQNVSAPSETKVICQPKFCLPFKIINTAQLITATVGLKSSVFVLEAIIAYWIVESKFHAGVENMSSICHRTRALITSAFFPRNRAKEKVKVLNRNRNLKTGSETENQFDVIVPEPERRDQSFFTERNILY